MTVSSSTNRVSYSGNGTLTTFAYTFKVFDQGDLTVILRSSTGTETVQTITTHYTVTGVGDVGGGNVVFVTAPSATETVVILREQDLTQGLDLVPNDPFPAQSLEESLDKLTFMIQQHEEELGRAIKASRTNTLTGSEFTISATDRANKVFAFDSSGDLSVTQELGTFKGNWAASTAYVERDLVKDTTTNDVFIVNSAHTSSGSLPLTTNTNSAKYDKIIDISNPPGDLTVGGNISTSGSVTAGNFIIGSADINENDLEAIDSVTAGTVAASKAVVVDVNKDISSFRNLTATGDITFGGLSDGTITVTAFVDEDNMASDSATLVPTQQSVKAYVDAQVATADALSEVLGNGNTTGGTNLVISSGDTLDVDGALDASGTISLGGNFPTGTDNVALGSSALGSVVSAGERNTIIGSAAGDGITNGDNNTALGAGALGSITTQSSNTAVGRNALTSTTGTANTALGNGAGSQITSGQYNTVIGLFNGNQNSLDIRTSSNNVVLSDGQGNVRFYANSSGNVGLGTVSPASALDVSGTVTATGGAFTGDVSFGDNDKAIFGAGSDLQIYSDGNSGIIKELSSTGSLYVQADQLVVQNAAATENKAIFATDGAVTLYYDNAAKLATTSTGIDVSGSITADGLTVDGSGYVYINTNGAGANPSGDRGLFLSWNRSNSIGESTIGFNNQTGIAPYLQFASWDGTNFLRHMRIDDNGDISFYEDTGTTAKFFWDASAESLGIGTSSPSADLHIVRSTNASIKIKNTQNSASTSRHIELYNNDETGSFKLSVARSGAGGGGSLSTSNQMEFQTNGSERMRIDSSGNLLVGKTTTAISTVGLALQENGILKATADGNRAGQFNRTNSDGEIIRLNKDGTEVGSIGALSSYLYLGGNAGTDAYVSFGDAKISPATSTGGGRDNAIDIGSSSYRFKDLYLSGGVYLGGTGSANKLDDYEEGTFTPTIEFGGSSAGVTYGTQGGSYIKIGNIVYVNIALTLTNNGTASGSATISNLPFSVADNTANTSVEGSVSISEYNNLSGVYNIGGFFQDFSNELLLKVATTSGGGQITSATNSHVTNTALLRLSGWYPT